MKNRSIIHNLKIIFEQKPIESKKINDIRKSVYTPITKPIIIKQTKDEL